MTVPPEPAPKFVCRYRGVGDPPQDCNYPKCDCADSPWEPLTEIQLPTKRTIPAQLRPLQAVYVDYPLPDPGRLAQMEVVSDTTFVFTLPDNWLTAEDIQALCDAVAIKTSRPAVSLTVNHAMRRAIIVLIDQLGKDEIGMNLDVERRLNLTGIVGAGNPNVLIDVDRDAPPRTILVTIESK